MRVLVGCEESQVVCKAFRGRGHEAYSCDLKPCSGGHPEWHIKDDIVSVLSENAYGTWDLIILHPDCTYMAVSGNRWYHNSIKRIEAVEWTVKLWELAKTKSDHVVLENPVSIIFQHLNGGKVQYIQPWQFGHPETKKTGIMLYNVPELKATSIVEPEYIIGKDGKRYSRIHYLTKSSSEKYYGKDRKTVRSKTFDGVANAFAEQWGEEIIMETWEIEEDES